MKKIISLLLVVVLTATAAIGGTLAYLTDRDSEANVFTVGNVSIDLEEDFDQGATLIPGVEIEKKPTITNTGSNDAWVWLEFAIPTALDNYVQGTEQGSNENVIHWNPKGATTEGYVTQERVEKAIADGFFGEMDTTNLSADYINENKMHWNVFNSIAEGQNAYQTEIEVDGEKVPYNVYVLLYNKALTPGETTLPNIEKVFLDARVDIDPDGNWSFVEDGVATAIEWNSETNGNPIIYVSAYAMQTEGFADASAAYAAYQTQWGDNGTEYAPVEDTTDPDDTNTQVQYNGTTYETIYEAVAAANENGGGTIILMGSSELSDALTITSNITIESFGHTLTRAEGYTGSLVSVGENAALTLNNVAIDGGNIESIEPLVYVDSNSKLTLNRGAVIQNYNGTKSAIHIHTNGSTTIVMNDGSAIQNNYSTEAAPAITGGSQTTFEFNGGKITGNKTTTGGASAIWSGNWSTMTISGDFELTNNYSEGGSSAIRFCSQTHFRMNDGTISGNTNAENKGGAIYGWNTSMELFGGTITGNGANAIDFDGGRGMTIGETNTTDTIVFGMSTNHDRVYLAENFGTIHFDFDGTNTPASNLNFVPAEGYVYTEGDEDRLICEHEGYSTYWDVESNTFKLQAAN